MLKLLRENSAVKFSAIILLVLLISESLLWIWMINSQREAFQRILAEKVRDSASVVLKVVAAKQDPATVEQMLQQMLNAAEIYSIEVTDLSTNMILTKSKPYAPGATLRTIRLQHSGPEGSIRVVVRYSPDGWKGYLMPAMGKFVLFEFIVIIMLTVVFYFLLQREISEPVRDLGYVIDKAVVGDFTLRARSVPSTEIGGIFKRINLLMDNLSSGFHSFKAGLKNTVTAIAQLTISYKSVTDTVVHQRHIVEDIQNEISRLDSLSKHIKSDSERLTGLSEEVQSATLQLKASRQEVSQAINDVLKGIQHGSQVVAELRNFNTQFNELITNTSESFENASLSVEEIRRAVSDIDSAVKNSVQLSQQMTEVISVEGLRSIEDVSQTMSAIESEVSSLSRTIKTLEKNSEDIERIVAVIRDIAEKTRLLSLNAQILAVQSGAEGKSFSVVAEQMSELAAKTAESTKEIAELVSDVKTQIKGTTNEIRKTVKVVREAGKTVQQASEVFNKIQSTSTKNAEMIVTIRRATSEQTAGLTMVQDLFEKLRNMLDQVKTLVQMQADRLEYFSQVLNKMTDATELARNSTKQQTDSTDYLSETLEHLVEFTSKILRNVAEEIQIMKAIEGSFKELSETSVSIERDMREMSQLLKSLKIEAEDLQKSVEGYVTGR